MLESKYLYLFLNAFTLFFPLIQSFERKIRFFRNYKSLFYAFLFSSLLFIPWDIYFSYNGYWGFNDNYILGLRIFHLPIEEWLFFLTIPYACTFVYEVLNYYWPQSPFDRLPRSTWLLFGSLFFTTALFNIDQPYTLWVFLLNGIAAFLVFFFPPRWIGKYIRSYFVSLIGFLLINGILTGTGIDSQVVWYNSEVIFGYRLVTIPLEDFFYCFLLLGLNVFIFEYFKHKQ